MSNPSTHLTTKELSALLTQKTELYNEMINNEKSFEEVKTLFMEIRQIARDLRIEEEREKSIFSSTSTIEKKAMS